jgi:hypothetical protein
MDASVHNWREFQNDAQTAKKGKLAAVAFSLYIDMCD